MDSDFCITCIIHVVYANEASCQLVGHDRSKYVKLTLGNPDFMKNKEAFVGMVIQGAEQLYDRLRTAGRDGEEDPDIFGQTPSGLSSGQGADGQNE